MINLKANFTGFFLLMVLIVIFIIIAFEAPIRKESETIITIPYNSSTNSIIEEFNQNGYLEPSWLFKFYIKYLYRTKHTFVQAGSYKIPQEISNSELVENIFNRNFFYGKKVTFPEGTNIYEFASILKRDINIDSAKFVDLAVSKKFIQQLGINAQTLEGYLMPDTYYFNENQPIEQIIKTLVESQQKVIQKYSKGKKSFLNDYQALILASIIQAETPLSSEMPIISSVYHNRLRRGMMLQADPTILYAIYPRKQIFASDLKINDPYNTYKNSGLPPTPINNPGKIAIQSAYYPDKTDYYYFVRANDTSSNHIFSQNYSQHRQNVNKYRRN
ncbi:MAG TPA: endolytic transglycosylase MltG [Bacteroidetes bacterium]|nr:endolytic transglycosylase MltG [Bacteroidota bacterium]